MCVCVCIYIYNQHIKSNSKSTQSVMLSERSQGEKAIYCMISPV